MRSELTEKRYRAVDALRGAAIVLMVTYHTLWDLVCLHGVRIGWFTDLSGHLLQRTIRWSFLLISGFCFSMGRRKWKRGLLTLLCSGTVTLVTLAVLPEAPIRFGVLWLIGAGTLLTALLEKPLKRCDPWVGLGLCLALFVLTARVETGLPGGFGTPRWLYRDLLTAALGFPSADFISSDYVPLIPWLFVFWMGLFLYQIFQRYHWLDSLRRFGCAPLEWLGRHSLLIYMAHQPVIYGILYVIF